MYSGYVRAAEYTASFGNAVQTRTTAVKKKEREKKKKEKKKKTPPITYNRGSRILRTPYTEYHTAHSSTRSSFPHAPRRALFRPTKKEKKKKKNLRRYPRSALKPEAKTFALCIDHIISARVDSI